MNLALHASDAEDLAIISAHLQDAVGMMGDMTYLPKQRRFAMVLNRFVWMSGTKKGFFADKRPHRAQCGIHFDTVEGVKIKDLPQQEKDTALELLAIRFESSGAEDDPSGTIELSFAGIATVRLKVECIECSMQDMGEPYPVKTKPRHRVS